MLFLLGCGSSQTLSIKTNPPKAQVFIKELGSAKKEKIGETPILLEEDIINKFVNPGNAPVMIEITMRGYQKQQFIVNDLGKTSIDYDIDLEVHNFTNIITKIDTVGSHLIEAQKLMRAGNYENSIDILKNLLQDYPSSSIVNEFMGAAYYMKKDYLNSLNYYETAAKYGHKNIDAFKMMKYLEDVLKVKRPQSKKGNGK
jgi:tetratricopeptide (TPR) repeat protein